MVSELSLQLQELAQSIFRSPLLAEVRAFFVCGARFEEFPTKFAQGFFHKTLRSPSAPRQSASFGVPPGARADRRRSANKQQTNNKQSRRRVANLLDASAVI